MHVRIPDNATVTCISQRIVSPASLSDDEIHAALSSPSLTTGLDHWSLWTLICLYRHLQRQRWVGYLVETRLRTDLRQLGCAGSLGHPEEFSQSGMVPGEPDWKYEFHGRGCCLTNKRSGETIDLDFTDEGSSDRIDCYFYSHYLAALRDLSFPETLLKRSSPFEHSWQIEISRLAASGCSDSEHAFQLTEIGIQLAESLNPIVDSLEKLMVDSEVHSLRKVVFTALSLGDPVLAQQFSAQAQLSSELASLIRSKCLAEKENRSKELLPLLGEDPNRSGRALTALAVMGAEYSKGVVETMSGRNPVNGLANQSLQILIDWDGPDLSDWLKALLKQRYNEANAWSTFIQGLPWNRKENDRLPREYFITKLLLALFKRIPPQSLEPTYVTMAGALLGKCSGAVAGQAGLLLYLLSKDEGLRCLQTALSGRVPAAQSEAAAACVIINSDQSKAILVSALKNTETRIQHVAACALSMFPSHDARTLAYAWLEKNVGLKNPQGKELTIGDRTITTYSMEDVMQSNTNIFFSHDLKQLREDFGPFFLTRA